MTKKYQVTVDSYSLNELTEKLVHVIYGDHVIAGPQEVVPAFSNLVQSDPNIKGVTWELDYKSQADNLVNRLNRLLTGRKAEPSRELISIISRGSWYYVAALDATGKIIKFKAQGVKSIKKLLGSFNVHHTSGAPLLYGVGLDSIVHDITD